VIKQLSVLDTEPSIVRPFVTASAYNLTLQGQFVTEVTAIAYFCVFVLNKFNYSPIILNCNAGFTTSCPYANLKNLELLHYIHYTKTCLSLARQIEQVAKF